LQRRAATGLNGQAAKQEVSALWREGLDAGKYFQRSGREKCFSLDIPLYRTFPQPRLLLVNYETGHVVCLENRTF
jgi:hypothetical protein